MTVAILADIHSNIEALSVVLEHMESKGVNRIVCLGDVVGYGSEPRECVDLNREHVTTCIMGNHD